jgi:hypothetical protein
VDECKPVQVGSAIITEKPDVKWDDVAGLTLAKEALKEVRPARYRRARHDIDTHFEPSLLPATSSTRMLNPQYCPPRHRNAS